MVKKWKVYLIALITLVMCITTFSGLSTMNVYAFSGTNSSLTEQELYNATNTYNVDNTGFTDGAYHPDSDKDDEKITNDLIYNIRYNMSQKNDNQVMSTTQITVLTHGLGSNAGTWSNDYPMNVSSASFAYDSDSLISKIDEEVGGANIYWAKTKTVYKGNNCYEYNGFDLFNITNQTSTSSDYTNTSLVSNINDISKS